MKKINRYLIFLAVLVSLMFTVGCNGEDIGTSREEGIANVSFSLSDSSRGGLSVRLDPKYPPESVYWAYTAQKVDGLYTEGESEVLGDSGDTGSDGVKAGGYKLRPVKQGPATGLHEVIVGKFATGDWIFKVYGYKSCVVEDGVCKFSGLVYTGSTLHETVKVTKSAGATDSATVVQFVLTEVSSGIGTTGDLRISNLSITVPQEKNFVAGSSIKVKIWDTTGSSAVLVATSETSVTALKKPGDMVNLETFTIQSGKDVYAPGLYRFRLVAEYYDDYTELRKDNEYKYTGLTPASEYEGILDDGYALIGEVLDFPVEFRAGDVTSLKGDVSELSDAAEDFDTLRFGVYVAKTGSATGDTPTLKYWTSLADAIDYCADKKLTAVDWTGENVVTVLCDVVDGGYADLKYSDLTSNAVVLVNLAGHYVKNLKVEQGTQGTGTKTVFVILGNQSGSYNATLLNMFVESYIPVDTSTYVSARMIEDYASAPTSCWFDANPGTSPSSMYLSGVFGDLTCRGITYVSGGTAVKGKLASVQNAVITLGENVTVAGIGCNDIHGQTDTVANCLKSTWKGKTTTVIARNENGYVGDYTDSVINTNASTPTAFKRVDFNVNGGSETAKYTYGIEGCKITLPANTYTKTNARFLNWNTVASPTDTNPGVEYANEATYTVSATSPQTLYAQWSLPVGGRIYYVHQGVNDASYTFYKSNGDVITYTGIPTADTLADAVSYSVRGKTADMNDMFYVLDNNNGFVKGTPFGGYNINLGLNYRGIGGGKLNRGVIFKADGTVLKADALVVNSGESCKTMWAYVEYVNKWNGRTKVNATWGVQAPGGCTDWYMPNVEELTMLGVWAGVLSVYDTSYSEDFPKYRMSDDVFSTAINSRTVPDDVTDTDKRSVWLAFMKGDNGLSATGVMSCNEWSNTSCVNFKSDGAANVGNRWIKTLNKSGTVALVTCIRSF